MNDLDFSEPIQVSSFGFNVPCREFIIAAQVTRDKRMPMVDEFVLKTLALCESISVSRLTKFFGFTPAEMEIVLVDLQKRTLITLDGNEVSLHPTGKELFRTAGDGPPVIIDVESFPARIGFDLISKNMIRSRGLHNVKNLIDLSAAHGVGDIPESFAREAFHDNFRDYLRVIRRIKNPETWGLYAISDVIPGRFSFAQISGKQSLLAVAQPKLETFLIETDSDRPHRLRALTDAMSGALEVLSDPDPSAASRTEYFRLTANPSVEESMDASGFFNLRAWVKRECAAVAPDTIPFIGSLTLERNRKLLTGLISNEARSSDAWELFWFRPGGTLWGVTEDLQALLGELRAISRRVISNEGGFVSTLIAPASVGTDSMKRFDRIFDRGLGARAGRSSPAIEVLMVRDIFAVVSVLVPLAKDVNVWVGRITVNAKEVRRISDRLRPDDLPPELSPLWSERGKRAQPHALVHDNE